MRFTLHRSRRGRGVTSRSLAATTDCRYSHNRGLSRAAITLRAVWSDKRGEKGTKSVRQGLADRRGTTAPRAAARTWSLLIGGGRMDLESAAGLDFLAGIFLSL